MKHFLITYENERVASIKEFADRGQATDEAQKLQDAGGQANIFSASDKKHLGVNIGDHMDDEDSEFGFRGFGDEESD